MVSGLNSERLTHLHGTLYALREHALRLERNAADDLAQVADGYTVSARNLVHYLAIRQHDIRELQKDLAQIGLSSLGVLEPHVIASLDAVLTVLDRLRDGQPLIDHQAAPIDFDGADQLLHNHATRSLGPAPAVNATRIMVTMPSEAAEEPQLIESFLAQGMTIMRINCAHDHPDAWAAVKDTITRLSPENIFLAIGLPHQSKRSLRMAMAGLPNADTVLTAVTEAFAGLNGKRAEKK